MTKSEEAKRLKDNSGSARHTLTALAQEQGVTRSVLNAAIESGSLPAELFPIDERGRRSIKNYEAARKAFKTFLDNPPKLGRPSATRRGLRSAPRHDAGELAERRTMLLLAALSALECFAEDNPVMIEFRVQLAALPEMLAAQLASAHKQDAVREIIERALLNSHAGLASAFDAARQAQERWFAMIDRTFGESQIA